MSKIEILAPVGSEEMLRAAVFSGADAVYLGFSGFNARTGAGNFDADSLKEAVRFCHARGVAVHVALNTTVYGGELAGLADAVRAVAAQLRTAASRVRLPLLTPEGIARVPVDEIMWAESFGKRQTLVMTGGTLEVRHTLRELCEKLEPHGFLQVHRCYVVSCRYIFSIEPGCLIMDDRREIPISRYRLAACKEAFRRSISHGLDAAEHRPQGDL